MSLRDNVEKFGIARQSTDDNIIRRMRYACWIIRTTDTIRIHNIFSFAWLKWLSKQASVLRYICMACLVVSRFMQIPK